MRKVLITGAGGGGAIGFVKSLFLTDQDYQVIGVDSSKYKIHRSNASKTYLVPKANDPDYIPVLQGLIEKEQVDILHLQTTAELLAVSDNRERLGCNVFLPQKETVSICMDKFQTYNLWNDAKIKVPKNILINTVEDFDRAIQVIGQRLWLRPRTGTSAMGAIGVTDRNKGIEWIDRHDGWGSFLAAEHLETKTVTFESIWYKGKLVVAQQRGRLYWEFASYSASGVTGNTGASISIDDPVVTEIALKAIFEVDSSPHGAFGVDFTYDKEGIPNPTEINVGRLMSTHDFFAAAGTNFAHILVECAFDSPPILKKNLNPLPINLIWLRGMDVLPKLINLSEIEKKEQLLKELISNLNNGKKSERHG